jgi:hypothetical protein
MDQLAESLNAIVKRVADFFEILDLSFLVSGATSLFAFVFWFYCNDKTFSVYVHGWPLYVITIVICYILGLICFGGGRFLRRNIIQKTSFPKINYNSIFKAHHLHKIKRYKRYKKDIDGYRTQARMWSELRQNNSYGYSLPFLKKYWVMSTTYDGLIFSSIIWLFVCLDLRLCLICEFQSISSLQLLIVISILILLLFLCAYMANKYDHYQAEELIASVSAEENKK